ncbi:hypothetical protein CC80DRAFT_576750 [Byssothecium circinans]|uniref:Cora-domain-containing protein n=1 Tax=Byssothecium circinans TaxID=147558 RepID=A0A6A5TIU0_9PLEO|nr:hypothetical protein CC80DRAFT_576750 [Byssothecium circinans]
MFPQPSDNRMTISQHIVRRSTSNVIRSNIDSCRWSLKLFRKRPFGDRPFASTKGTLDTGRSVVDLFLDYSNSSIPSWRSEVLRKFMKRPRPFSSSEDIAAGALGTTRAYVDCRTSPKDPSPITAKGLTSDELAGILQAQRFGPEARTDSYRQLVHIAHLDPKYIGAIAETAWFHQAGALRDAIYKHLAFEASFRVRIPHSGFKVLLLELNLPYLALREGKSSSENVLSWEDMSFLEMESTEHDEICEYTIHKLHSSVTVCVYDDSRWAAYVLTNSFLDQSSHEEPSDGIEDDELSLNEDSDDELDDEPEDPLASDCQSFFIGVDEPIWDARKYWIRIAEIRVRISRDEWIYLVQKTEASINRQNNRLTAIFSHTSSGDPLAPARQSLAWTVRTITFLHKLRQQLIVSIRTWKRFDSPNGDKNFFRDMDDQNVEFALVSMRDSFAEMTGLKEKLNFLIQSCKESANIEGIRLNTESIAYSREANLFSREANNYSKLANKVNLKSYELAQRMNKVNLKNYSITLSNNLNAALALSTNYIMIPAGVVAAYFSIEEDIFGFGKHAPSFIISLLVLYAVLRILSLVTFLLRKYVPEDSQLLLLLFGQLDRLNAAGEKNLNLEEDLIEILPVACQQRTRSHEDQGATHSQTQSA